MQSQLLLLRSLQQCHSQSNSQSNSNPSDSNLTPPHYSYFPQSTLCFPFIALLIVHNCATPCGSLLPLGRDGETIGTGHSQQHGGSGVRSRPFDAILSVPSKKPIYTGQHLPHFSSPVPLEQCMLHSGCSINICHVVEL